MNSPVAATRGRRAWLGTSLCALICITAHAAPPASEPLPDPLTLDYALSLAATPDSTVQAAQADVALAQAQQQDAAADTGVQAALQGRAFKMEPSSVAIDQGHDDSSISLVVRKPLFDFGRSRAGEGAAQAELQGSEMRLLNAQQQRRLNIMARYFDVLLAELAVTRDDAALALADRVLKSAVAREQLGQISRIDRGAAEDKFLAAKRQQLASAASLRTARTVLADTLNKPGQLPATLSAPQYTVLDRPVPPLEALLDKAQTNNPLLLAQRARVDAALQRVQAARAQRLPVLNGELAASDYTRQTDERDAWHAGVTLEVPLYTGGRTQAAIAARHAELQRDEAEYAQARQSLTQALQTTLDDIATLQVQREQARVQLEYRSLALERSKGLHGNAQDNDVDADRSQVAAARLFRAQTDYQLALSWAHLDALLGGPADATAPIGNAAIPIPLKN
jgi:outer membrane protein TolC